MSKNINNNQEKSSIVVNNKGQLCETLEFKSGTFIHVFNSIIKDNDRLTFNFSKNNISQKQGW